MSEDAPYENAAAYEGMYYLSEQELAFFQSQTGIKDEEELKQHIMSVRAEALKVTPYTCIKAFGFTKLIANRSPVYQQAIAVGKERKGAIFLDIGCCFGVDVRKAVADGWPAGNAIGSDLNDEYLDLGHKLFRTTPKDFPAHFIGGDAFDPDFLRVAPTLDSLPEAPVPPLSSLTTLTPLHGHVSVIHASSFFHLFNEEQQLELARKLAGLLSLVPGSMIFGLHASRADMGLRTEEPKMRNGEYMFCHTDKSWKELWDGVVFKKGMVEVKASLQNAKDVFELDKWAGAAGLIDKVKQPIPGPRIILVWSVTRL